MKKLISLLTMLFVLLTMVFSITACDALDDINNAVGDLVTGIPTSSEGLEYTLNPDGKGYTVTGIGYFTGTDLVIGRYNGLPVTSIGDNAFYDCYNLTNVTIGNSVTSFGNGAFSDCSGLTSITIPDSVTSIGDYAFSYCYGLTSVTIGNSVTSIGDSAFCGCSGLTSITIPDSVTSIGNYAFSGCSGLTSITVDASNPSYKSIDGNLYTKDGKTLIQYAIGKPDTNFTILSCVTTIGVSAFSHCRLTTITIPDSVTSIGDSAFSGCSALTSIKYRGTKEQWNAISKGDNWDYLTGDYTITYNYTGE